MGGYAFPRSLHLKRPSEFRAVFDRGNKRHSRALICFRLDNGLPEPRLGVAVGRRIGGAVVRNRIKRRLREAFRLGWRDLGLAGTDLVIVAKRGSAELSGAEISADFTAAVARRGR
jgi:ribonuclease P protein component